MNASDVSDDAFEERLRRAADLIDEVPPASLRAARTAHSIRRLDAELAELVFDSLGTREAQMVRGGGEPWLLTFEAGATTVDIEVSTTRRGLRVLGRISPEVAIDVEIRSGDRTIRTSTDPLGRFVADEIPGGATSLRLRWGERSIVTEWLTLPRATPAS
jgi:hypothetical protein